jgi:hypothetical protein
VKNYKVTTYGEATYTVSLNDDGIVDVDGLLPETANNLKASVERHMERRNLPAITALGLAVGRYSEVEEVTDESVTDSP